VTLRELLYKKGVISDLKQTTIKCPFHDDHTPSATLFTNTLKCWSKCGQTFKLQDFYTLYGIDAMGLQQAPEPLPEPEDEVHGKTVMFVGPAD
jgi:hypothetical protein